MFPWFDRWRSNSGEFLAPVRPSLRDGGRNDVQTQALKRLATFGRRSATPEMMAELRPVSRTPSFFCGSLSGILTSVSGETNHAGRAAIFLDRDGTLNIERCYLSDPAQVQLYPGTGEALRRMQDLGFRLFIVTNQSGIGRGYYTEDDMHRVNARVLELLGPQGVVIDRIYYAAEAPEQPSRGRKPSPQFLFDARDAFGLDLARSYMVGDKLADVECGWNAGVKHGVLVRTGYGAETEGKHPGLAGRAWIVDSLADFVRRLEEQDQPGPGQELAF